MVSSPSAGDSALLLLLVAGVLIVFALWAWRLGKGIRVRLWFFALFAVFYELLFLLVLEEVARLPWGRLGPAAAFVDLLLFAATLIPGFRYILRTTRFEVTEKGRWIYRGGLGLPVAWLALFLIRYAVELALLGRVYLLTPTYTHTVSIPTFAVALILVDALFSVSTGLAMGEVIGIWWGYHERKGRGPAPSGATASGPGPVPP